MAAPYSGFHWIKRKGIPTKNRTETIEKGKTFCHDMLNWLGEIVLLLRLKLLYQDNIDIIKYSAKLIQDTGDGCIQPKTSMKNK